MFLEKKNVFLVKGLSVYINIRLFYDSFMFCAKRLIPRIFSREDLFVFHIFHHSSHSWSLIATTSTCLIFLWRTCSNGVVQILHFPSERGMDKTFALGHFSTRLLYQFTFYFCNNIIHEMALFLPQLILPEWSTWSQTQGFSSKTSEFVVMTMSSHTCLTRKNQPVLKKNFQNHFLFSKSKDNFPQEWWWN